MITPEVMGHLKEMIATRADQLTSLELILKLAGGPRYLSDEDFTRVLEGFREVKKLYALARSIISLQETLLASLPDVARDNMLTLDGLSFIREGIAQGVADQLTVVELVMDLAGSPRDLSDEDFAHLHEGVRNLETLLVQALALEGWHRKKVIPSLGVSRDWRSENAS